MGRKADSRSRLGPNTNKALFLNRKSSLDVMIDLPFQSPNPRTIQYTLKKIFIISTFLAENEEKLG